MRSTFIASSSNVHSVAPGCESTVARRPMRWQNWGSGRAILAAPHADCDRRAEANTHMGVDVLVVVVVGGVVGNVVVLVVVDVMVAYLRRNT